jgi:NADP-dependent 3-hydroxy acid dehydrogenase YdfG
VRVSAIYPPALEDISPLDAAAWNGGRAMGSLATNRDVVEASLFALSRPRHVTLASIVIDPDRGGLYSS